MEETQYYYINKYSRYVHLPNKNNSSLKCNLEILSILQFMPEEDIRANYAWYHKCKKCFSL